MKIPVLSHKQFEVLQDIKQVLLVSHCAQQLLSAERTPTLALALPVYKSLTASWKSLAVKFPMLEFAITEAIGKLEKYVELTRTAPVHAAAMLINPSMKMSWIDQYWSSADAKKARIAVRDQVCCFYLI